MLLDLLLKTRDKLNLSPADPIEAVFDRLSEEEQGAEEADSTALAEARQRLEAKAQEVRKLSDELKALRDESSRHAESPAKAPAPTAQSPPGLPAEDPALGDLRRRMRALESELKERHTERNQLRRELEQARQETKALRAEKETNSKVSLPEEQEKRENELLVEEETLGLQPPRLPVFTARFRDSLGDLPETVVRAALRLVGRLAAGDEAAFHGSRRLRERRDLLRQRVGLAHRLLFRLEKETLEVVALIPRSGFERFLRTLGRNS